MILLKKSLISFVLFIISMVNLYATGPSYINAEIRPISVNDKGEILCRTRFVKNSMGAHDYMDVEYGLCVITKDTIEPLSSKLLSFYADSLDDDTYMERRHLCDSIFRAVCFDKNVISELKRLKVYKKYNFNNCNIERFRIDKVISVSLFNKFKQKDILKMPQYALYGGKGYCDRDENIYVLYDFGNVIFTENIRQEFEKVGASFDYVVPLFGGIEYECWKITGVLFLDN